LASAVDTGQLAALAAPTLIEQRRVPGLKLHDDRVIRLLYPGGFVCNWTSRELHTRVVARHHLARDEYRLSQLRYDLSKLRAKGLIERIGKTRRYRLTPAGLKLGVVLVKLRMRLLGPLVSRTPTPRRDTPTPSTLPTARPTTLWTTSQQPSTRFLFRVPQPSSHKNVSSGKLRCPDGHLQRDAGTIAESTDQRLLKTECLYEGKPVLGEELVTDCATRMVRTSKPPAIGRDDSKVRLPGGQLGIPNLVCIESCLE
jgi:hypothetical protein